MSDGLRNTLLVIGGIVVVGAVLYFQWQAHKKKVAEFTAFAKQRGWTYLQRDNGLGRRFVGDPFDEGRNRHGVHALRGKHRGQHVLAFEYRYQEVRHESGGKRRTETFYYTVAALKLPNAKPTLQVGPEGMLSKLAGAVGFRDLQLESEEFNKKFRIKGDDDKFSYDILHPRMMEWLLADPRAQSVPFRFERGDLVVWEQGKIDLRKVDWMVDYACDIVERVPSFVWKQ
jgi:uncharacterized protein DUF3137